MRKMADVLDGLSDISARAYSDKTKKPKKEIRSMMDSETWLFGSEIKDAGFVDEILKTDEDSDKDEYMISAKAKMNLLSEKLSTKKFDYQKACALLQEPENNNNHPANSAGEITMEVQTVNFKELMASNPAANAEYETLLAEAKKAGFEDCKKEFENRSTKAVAILEVESYPKQVKAVALQVIKGEKSLETLDTMVANSDMFAEMLKSQAAMDETKKIGDTKGETGEQVSQTGEIKTDADYVAEVARMKAAYGIGGK
jgi:hypothetical protein